MGVFTEVEKSKVDRLVRISLAKPLDHKRFVPWKDEIQDYQYYLPENLISLQGHPL